MPECLECKAELEFYDTIETYVDGDIIIIHEVGHCPKCRKKYKWEDVYEFSHFENLEVLEED